jgi:nucleoside-diphosphate-sugar epimerase
MKILVTGGAGYIGCNVVEDLLKEGFDVRVFDSLVFGGEQMINFFKYPNFEFVKGDLTEMEDVQNAVKGCDSVIHLGALVFIGDEKLSFQVNKVNFLATKNLVRECINNNIHNFLFTSTCSNYGISKKIVNEDSPLIPTSAYSDSKIKTEEYLLRPEIQKKLNPLILRLATVFGVSPRMRFDLTINEFCKQAVVDKKIELFNPNAWRPGIHVNDISHLILEITSEWYAGLPYFEYPVYNVGGDELNYQKIQIYDIIKDKIPDLELKIKETTDVRDYRVSFDRIQNEFGFKPSISIKKGVNKILDFLQKGMFPNPKDTKYYNLETYQKYYGERNE